MHNFYKVFSLLIIAFIYPQLVSAKQNPFVILESHKRVISKSTLDSLQASKMMGISISGNALILADSNASFVVTTGPEDDMLSFRIHGLRNPKFVMRAGSKLHISFINTDGDMQHDMRISADKSPFPISPPATDAIGTSKQMPEQTGTFSGEEIIVQASGSGEYSYYCSVRGHAKGGMWGKIIVVDSKISKDEMMRLGADTSNNSKKGMNGMEGMDMNMNMDGMDMPGMDMKGMSGMGMKGSVLLTVPMTQEGSGTSWHPESSPIYAAMYQTGDWMSMLHGHIAIRYTDQGSVRGDHKFDSPNYIMAMTQHPLGSTSQIMFRGMFSFDWFTEGGYGYPLLLQTGETWQGKMLYDRQHPHDFFSELSTTISTKFSESMSGFLYLGYPGEPAIGPPAFMHRLSAMSNPDAPISHHWQDATHITFGVATAGIKFDRFKIEGSLFTGAAPDEDRFNFDKPLFDSYSGRISYNPTSEIALQFSRAFEKNPDRDFSNEWLSTASAIYTHDFGGEEWISNTLVWSSKKSHHSITEQASVLAESEFHFLGNAIYGRFEYVEKSQAELVIAFNPLEKEPLKELTLGINRKLFDLAGVDLDLGVQGTVNIIPKNIAFVYGDEYPKAFEVYLALHPKMNTMGM